MMMMMMMMMITIIIKVIKKLNFIYNTNKLQTLLCGLCELYSVISFDYRALGNSRKLEGTAEHLIDSSKNRIGRFSFEF